MRSFGQFLADLLLVALSTIAALILRDNFEFNQANFNNLLPYLALTMTAALPILLASRFNQSIWRLSTLSDYTSVVVAVTLIVTLAVTSGFLLMRLTGIARSLPLIQALVMLASMISVRAMARLRYLHRQTSKSQKARGGSTALQPARENVLVVGVNELTRMVLRLASEIGPDQVSIAGIVGLSKRQTGRMAANQRVLGTVDELPSIIKQLEVHGVYVDRIIVTAPVTRLSPRALKLLRDLETRDNGINVKFVERLFGFSQPTNAAPHDPATSDQTDGSDDLAPSEATLREWLSRPYWQVKRAIDFFGSLILLIALSPLLAIIFVLAGIELRAFPMFWQQRPGRFGRPIQVLKFQTMGAALDATGERLDDDQRVTKIGRFLRATRLDELPQLINVIKGDMSFIGPRPLLPHDQPNDATARLSVRPGITGWAQVNGGRNISIDDKTALDIWYVRNASLMVDARIVFETLKTIVVGDRDDDSDAGPPTPTPSPTSKSGKPPAGHLTHTADEPDKRNGRPTIH